MRELAAEPHLTLLCGRYEGVDERVVEGLPAEEVSIGDYVLSGGELPALVLIEAVTRLVPGRDRAARSRHERDSFAEPGLLDHPALHAPAGVPGHGRARRAAVAATTPRSSAGGGRPPRRRPAATAPTCAPGERD